MTTQAHDPAQDLVQLPLKDRMNLGGDIKEVISNAIKELARKEIRAALKAKGFPEARVDSADRLKTYLTVQTPMIKSGGTLERIFIITVKEVKS